MPSASLSKTSNANTGAADASLLATLTDVELHPLRLLSRGGTFKELFVDLFSNRQRARVDQAKTKSMIDIPSLTIRAGDRIILSGNNGSGKSTLCKLLSGNLVPSTGRVTTPGYIHLVTPDAPQLVWELTLEENCQMFLQLLEVSEGADPAPMETLVRDVLEFAGISSHAKRPVKELSLGMLTRFWLSLMTIPRSVDLLIIDEVHRAQDQAFIEPFWKRANVLIAASRASILVTHVHEDRNKVPLNREIHLSQGKIEWDRPLA